MDFLWYIFLFFTSLVGMVYFGYGKKNMEIYFLLTGIVLMIYPYFVSDRTISVIVGIILILFPIIKKKYN